MLLRVNKHSDLKKSNLYIMALVLNKIKKVRVEKLSKLKSYIEKRVFKNESCINSEEYLYITLNYLFLIGVIDYNPKSDSIEYIGK